MISEVLVSGRVAAVGDKLTRYQKGQWNLAQARGERIAYWLRGSWASVKMR